MISNDSLISTALNGVCGKIHIDTEDLRWTHLFDSINISFILQPNQLNQYLDKLIDNNPTTSNFLLLIDHTLSRLNEISRKKSEFSNEIIEQCCIGLYLCSLVIHHFNSRLSSKQLRTQFHLSSNWPYDYQENTAIYGNISNTNHNDSRIDKLFEELAYTINSSHENVWMKDIKFFCLDLLLAFLSTQLYDNMPSENNECFGSDDIFLNYLYMKAEFQLRFALGPTASGNSKLFSDSIPVQLVRGLLTHSCYCDYKNKVAMKEEVVSSSLLNELMSRFGSTKQQQQHLDKKQQLLHPNVSLHIMKIFLIEWISYLPFSVDYLKSFSADINRTDKPHSINKLDTMMVPNKVSGNLEVVESSMQIQEPHPLSSRCLSVLTILLHNRRSGVFVKQHLHVRKPNPFREAFCLLYDQSLTPASTSHYNSYHNNTEEIGDSSMNLLQYRHQFIANNVSDHDLIDNGFYQCADEEMNNSRSRSGSLASVVLLGTRIHVNFNQIISTLTNNLSDELYSLLLYSLLQAHPIFIEIVNSTGIESMANLLSSSLQVLYNLTSKSKLISSSTRSIDHLYVIIVCILMMIQDSSSVAQKLANTNIQASWYIERPQKQISLNNLIILCQLRTIMYSVRASDMYLLSNATAILFNISMQVLDLLPYTAERLVIVATQLCNRIISSTVGHVSSTAIEDHGTAVLSMAVTSLMQFISIVLRSKDMVLKNIQLLYALMRDYEKISFSFSHQDVFQRISNYSSRNNNTNNDVDQKYLPAKILVFTKYYLNKIESCLGDKINYYCTASQIVERIKYEMNISSDINESERDGFIYYDVVSSLSIEKRTYIEADNPELFFVPIAWTNTLRCTPEIPWSFQYIHLLDPISAGFISIQEVSLLENFNEESIDESNQV